MVVQKNSGPRDRFLSKIVARATKIATPQFIRDIPGTKVRNKAHFFLHNRWEHNLFFDNTQKL